MVQCYSKLRIVYIVLVFFKHILGDWICCSIQQTQLSRNLSWHMMAKTDLVSKRCLENLEVMDISKISYINSNYSLFSSSLLCNKSFSHWDGSLISLTTVKESKVPFTFVSCRGWGHSYFHGTISENVMSWKWLCLLMCCLQHGSLNIH